MKLQFTAILSVVIMMTGCVSAKNKPSQSNGASVTSILPGAALLIGFNRNNDYVIDEDEFTSGKLQTFDKVDLNGDGVVLVSEFRFWQPKATGSPSALPNLVHFDRNLNDRITRSEFETGMDKLFNDADENNNGRVSYQELVTMVSPPESRSKKGSSRPDSGDRKRKGQPRN